MKKILTVFLVAALALCFALPVMAFDAGSKLFGASEGSIVLDGYITAGKQFSANYSVSNNLESFIVTSNEHQWFMKAELGIKIYDIARPFIELETLTGINAKRTYGLDIYFPMDGLDAGIRTMYVSDEQYAVSKNKYGYVGAIIKW
jgi:hypothetical protein